MGVQLVRYSKINKRCRLGIIAFVFLILALILVSGCDKKDEELERIASPDHKVEAVVVLKAGLGATTSSSYQISIVPRGEKPTHWDRVFAAEGIEDVDVQWTKQKLLEIEYKNARIVEFRNFWEEIFDSGLYAVEIREIRRD